MQKHGVGSPPVIVGSGLTGMVVSRSLARAGVRHVLVGGPPNDLPRLGESLNLEGTLAVTEWLPEYAEHYFAKDSTLGYNGDYELDCTFDLDRSRVARRIFRLLGHEPPTALLHVDRLGLDAALYADTVAHPLCRQIDAKVTTIGFDAAADAVTGIGLSDGTDLDCSYVFDATNQAGVIARAAGVERSTIGPMQRVVYTHFHRANGSAAAGGDRWRHQTRVVRLSTARDGCDALAWLIPLRDYVSVGVSQDADEPVLGDDELLAIAATAFGRVGTPFADWFPERAHVMGFPFGYYRHARAYGANWLLAGPTYCQVWWTSGSGVGTAFAAAEIAPHALADPLTAGRAYQSNMDGVLPIHDAFDWFARVGPAELTPRTLIQISDRFIQGNVRRMANSARFGGNRGRAIVGFLVYHVVRVRAALRGFCQVHVGPISSAADYGAPATPD